MKRSSIRARLLLASVALVATGLLAADFATYHVLRTSLLQRVDTQLRSARLVAAELFNRRLPGFGGGRGSDGEGAPVTLAEWLDGTGNILSRRDFSPFRSNETLDLPRDLPGSDAWRSAGAIRIFTTRASGTGTRYRVLANAVEGGGTVVLALPLGDTEATLHRLLAIEVLVTLLVLGALAAASQWAVRVGLRPLQEMEAAAADIAAGNLSRRVDADPDTEAGRLGMALNAMLEKIEAAFAERRAAESKLRRFVGDASHELRTPLTSIRGYAELFRRGAQAHPDDLERSMRRIEQESSRMGALVDELLLLARLDQGRALESAPVDLERITLDAVSDARATQPERPIETETEPIVLEGDELRLRQVLGNLLTNALEHTAVDTPVHVALSKNGAHARIQVTDEGEGLTEEDRARIFDRFYRVDESRSRERGGTGLGLSIVKAIVEAHGGTVDVESRPGEGARFSVELPVTSVTSSDATHRPVPN